MFDMIEKLKAEADKLHCKYERSKGIAPDYFEPGMMEHLDKYEGLIDETRKNILLRFEARGTRYYDRTEQIEKVKVGDTIKIERDSENPFNGNNFTLLTENGQNIGNMPAELCNVIAPMYDKKCLTIKKASVSYVEPISKRHRYAKQAVLFVEMICEFFYN